MWKEAVAETGIIFYLMLGVGIVSGINIGNMSETPGLGAKASDSSFKDQFSGKSSSEIALIK